jgi:hypothetical protein
MIITDWQARHGLSGTDYQTAFDELAGRGYRLIKIAGAEQAGDARFSGIWQRRGGTPWQARHGISEADYQSTVTSLGTITTMTTGSAASGGYACGWGVDAGRLPGRHVPGRYDGVTPRRFPLRFERGRGWRGPESTRSAG